MQNMKKFQDESRLTLQRNNVVADITENQSKIKGLEREIKKHQKEIDKLEVSLKNIDREIANSREVYQTAFAFILENDHQGNVMDLFKTYQDQTSLVDRYTNLKCEKALKVYVKYTIKTLSSWEDLQSLHNL